ncbi:glycoside hydrolase family 97 catalytic domain-containing protein [Streptomyces sp. NBC_00873]|uniref:glycoside hydrolase family 97 catalytic domain-containing protein n=1 Tax=unclassified Streptomyces TaxID=2593676 RepID=UPI00386A2731|nr:glycoside hydrolase family 97 catalytic domain-containing protein [Streptomyces sp. NBC_00873]WTA41829.1 glycoside hydrolase family 97 catalytic domain-containing protein [Streptomyces sp. NBC_00842]
MHVAPRNRIRAALAVAVATATVALVAVNPTSALASPAAAAGEPATWVVTGPSPTAPASAQVQLDSAGKLTFAVADQGVTVLAPSQIGIETETADLTKGLEFQGRADRIVNENYTMTVGKQRERHAAFRESTFSFVGSGGTRMDLVVRVSSDGVAYRYVLPEAGGVKVKREASSFSLPTDATAWLQPYVSYYETKPAETTAGAAATGDFGLPSLFNVNGTYVLLTESDVDGRYSGGRLTHQAGSGTYGIKLADAQVTSTGPLATPWRTAIVGDLATVTTSTLTDDLAPPTRVTDTSWIHPGSVAWSWLVEHDSPRDPARQRQYIDFAARNGWPYVLIDAGWNRSWVPEITRYARARGVEVLLWFHWTDLDTAQERDTTLPLIKSWGVAGVKIDFMESDSQARFKWYDDVLKKTAELKLMVNFHGATIPRGIQRTWPHVMSMESARGLEYMTLDPPDKLRAVLNTTLPFTRNVVGSMDPTPTVFSITGRDTTDAHELATFMVFESGWQHGADSPESYRMQPEALRMMDQLPTAWDKTRLLSGHPGKEVLLARRSGDRWFLGGLSAVSAKTFKTPLNFLPEGQWRVETVHDGPSGLIRETEIVSAKDTFSVPVATNGGFLSMICRYSADRSTCDQPVRKLPSTSLTMSSTETDARPGDAVDVNGTFKVSADGPITDVQLRVMPPTGWQVDGPTVSKPRMRDGESIEGHWAVTPPEKADYGYVDLPVVATFRFPNDPADRPVHVEKAVRVFVQPPAPSGTAYLSDLPFVSATNGWGPVERDKSNADSGADDGTTLTIGGKTYAKGIGAHASSEITIFLGGACRAFHTEVGVDDEVADRGSVAYQVLGDGRQLAGTGVVRGTDSAHLIDTDVTGVRMLTLRVTDGGDGNGFDHADWADARVICG